MAAAALAIALFRVGRLAHPHLERTFVAAVDADRAAAYPAQQVAPFQAVQILANGDGRDAEGVGELVDDGVTGRFEERHDGLLAGEFVQ